MGLHTRLAVVAGLCLMPLLPLSLRLAQLQVMRHRAISEHVAGVVLRSTSDALTRADIVDRRGRLLARSVPYYACYVERSRLHNRAGLTRELARLLSLPEAEVRRRLQGDERFPVVKEELTGEEVSALAAARLDRSRLLEYGVGVELRQKRCYPNQDLARGILGKVGSDQKGLSGLELAFDRRLQGRPRRLEYVRDGAGRAIYLNADNGVDAPAPLRLTLDRDYQFHAEEVLREAAAQFQARGGMIVVLDPGTGEILAMASTPANALKNPAIQDTYEPGSTFKLVAAAAALEESLVSETDTFFCENGLYQLAPGVAIHDHEPAGTLTLQGILERSSNIGIAKVAEKLGAMRFYRYSRAFGFDIKTGVDLPGETAGVMKPLSSLSRVVLAASSYGYGIGVSALQVANSYNALANGGTLYEPAVVGEGRRPSRVRRVISEATARTLARMLESNVDRGTGMTARIPGYRVAGKTGTARKIDPRTGKYSTSAYMASFVGFLPVDEPRWTILVVVDEPKGQYYGAQVAAPVFGALGRRLLALAAVPPDPQGPLAKNP